LWVRNAHAGRLDCASVGYGSPGYAARQFCSQTRINRSPAAWRNATTRESGVPGPPHQVSGATNASGNHVDDLPDGVESVKFGNGFERLHHHGGGGEVSQFTGHAQLDAAVPVAVQGDASGKVAGGEARFLGKEPCAQVHGQHLFPELRVGFDDAGFIDLSNHGRYPTREVLCFLSLLNVSADGEETMMEWGGTGLEVIGGFTERAR